MARNAHPKTSSFRGLNNVTDPLRLGLGWLQQADNVNISNRNAVERCGGYTRITSNTSITGAFNTEDLARLFVVDNSQLLEYAPALGTYTVLDTGLTTDPMGFVEINNKVYYTNGTDYGVVDGPSAKTWGIATPAAPQLTAGTGVLPAGSYAVCCTYVAADGRESGSGEVAYIDVPDDSQIAISDIPQLAGHTTNVYATMRDGTVFYLLAERAGAATSYNCGPNALGEEMPFWQLEGPRGSLPAFYAGQIYLAEYLPSEDYTVIWRSEPLHFHLFDLGGEAIAVPGKVVMLEGLDSALIIGTEDAVYFFNGEQLGSLASYGVLPGWHADRFDGLLYFWTLRGLCSALPFQNLTEKTLSVAPGESAAGKVMEQGGAQRYVVALREGGGAYNER